MLDLLENAIRKTDMFGECYWNLSRGSPQGSALSPLFGAIMLHKWDKEMKKSGFTAIRYMDDLLVFTKTRPKLRKVVKKTYQILGNLKLELHTNHKTFIEKIDKGFNYFGLHFKRKSVSLCKESLTKFSERISRYYVQVSLAAAVHPKIGCRSSEAAVSLYTSFVPAGTPLPDAQVCSWQHNSCTGLHSRLKLA